MNTRQKERAKRIIYLKEYVVNNSKDGKKTDYRELIAKLMMTKYLSYRTAREDVDSLIYSGFCERHEDEIFIPEKNLVDEILTTDQ